MRLNPIGIVRSPLTDRADAPKQGSEGAPEAVIEIDPAYADALEGLAVGQDILVFTWLHQADREVLRVHPRGDLTRPIRGVFSTRSPDRPNPIGLHAARITGLDGLKLSVKPLEAIDGTPVVDIKNA